MALWGSLQVKFGLSYIAVIAAVLLLLNTYPLLVSEDLVFRSKETNMTGSVSVVVYSLAGLNRLNQENVAAAMAVVEETGLSRVLVTDSTGLVLYDTRETGSAVGKYTFYSEIVQALEGYDAFSCSYRDGAFRSRTASPVLYQNRIIGAVYAYEYDTEQATLLEGLQSNLLKLSAPPLGVGRQHFPIDCLRRSHIVTPSCPKATSAVNRHSSLTAFTVRDAFPPFSASVTCSTISPGSSRRASSTYCSAAACRSAGRSRSKVHSLLPKFSIKGNCPRRAVSFISIRCKTASSPFADRNPFPCGT